MSTINAFAVGGAATCGLLIYAGFRGVTPIQALRDISGGTAPGPTTSPYTPSDTSSAPATGSATGSGKGVALLNQMEAIGTGKGYSENTSLRTGPDYFDCSGLVYRAGASLGIWPSGTTAFNTASFIIHTKQFGLTYQGTGAPQTGDIVWWSTGHMGVATDSTHIFAARSSHETPQIGISTISGVNAEHGPHRVYRFA